MQGWLQSRRLLFMRICKLSIGYGRQWPGFMREKIVYQDCGQLYGMQIGIGTGWRTLLYTMQARISWGWSRVLAELSIHSAGRMCSGMRSEQYCLWRKDCEHGCVSGDVGCKHSYTWRKQ